MNRSITQSTRTSLAILCMASLTLLCFAVTAQAGSMPTANLLIQLDGTDVTTSGANVTSWNDQAALGGAENFGQDFNTGGTSDPTLLSG